MWGNPGSLARASSKINPMQQTWDASLYAGNGRFVAVLAESLVEALDPAPANASSTWMWRRLPDPANRRIRSNRGRGRQLTADGGRSQGTGSGCPLRQRGITPLRPEIRRRLLECCFALDERSGCRSPGRAPALKPGGRFVAECGGQGNIAAIRVALLAVLTAHGIPAERIENNRFFGAAEYRGRLESHGYLVEEITPDTTSHPRWRPAWALGSKPSATASWNCCPQEGVPAPSSRSSPCSNQLFVTARVIGPLTMCVFVFSKASVEW